MKADLYVQGNFWATIDLPEDSFFALLAKARITEAQQRADQLKADLETIHGVKCSITLPVKEPATYTVHDYKPS